MVGVFINVDVKLKADANLMLTNANMHHNMR